MSEVRVPNTSFPGPVPPGLVVVGVALALPEPDASQLQEARRRFGDPVADFSRTHITLSGPQTLAAAELARVEEHLAGVAARHPAFRVLLNGTGSFRPTTEVVFLRVAAGEAECTSLATHVQSGILAGAAAYPYHPHVTLAHDVASEGLDAAQAELAQYRLEFEVTALWLYVRGGDGHWRPVRSFDLALDVAG